MDHFERFHRQENQSQASKTSYINELLQDSEGKGRDNQNSSVPGRPTSDVTEKEDMGSRDIGSGDRGSIQDLKGERVLGDKGRMLTLEGNTVSSSHVSCEMCDSCCLMCLSLPFPAVKLNRALIHSLSKPVIKKEEVEKRSSALTDSYLHMNNLKVQYVDTSIYSSIYLSIYLLIVKSIYLNMSVYMFIYLYIYIHI